MERSAHRLYPAHLLRHLSTRTPWRRHTTWVDCRAFILACPEAHTGHRRYLHHRHSELSARIAASRNVVTVYLRNLKRSTIGSSSLASYRFSLAASQALIMPRTPERPAATITLQYLVASSDYSPISPFRQRYRAYVYLKCRHLGSIMLGGKVFHHFFNTPVFDTSRSRRTIENIGPVHVQQIACCSACRLIPCGGLVARIASLCSRVASSKPSKATTRRP